jgi:hypothetical protein
MHHLKHHLFGIILLSSFRSAFADEYDPKPDIFDQTMNTLVPLLIVFLFKGSEEKQNDPVNQGRITQRERKIFDRIRQKISFVKIRRIFDDFLFLLTLFILPCIVFHKSHERFATPIWISILSGTTAGIVFITIIFNYCFHKKDLFIIRLFFCASPFTINICHISSDICFLFYTRSISVSEFRDVFIYLHSVTGIIGATFLIFNTIMLIIDFINDPKRALSRKYLIIIAFIYLHAVTGILCAIFFVYSIIVFS